MHTGRHAFSYMDCAQCGPHTLHHGSRCVHCHTDRGYDKAANAKVRDMDYRAGFKPEDRRYRDIRAARRGQRRGLITRKLATSKP